MKNFIKNILLLGIIGILFYLFRFEVGSSFYMIKDRYFPCSSPIFYSIGAFDERFGLTKEDFIKALKEAELIWEPVNKELFIYEEENSKSNSIFPKNYLKINLIYDSRQEDTMTLQKMGIVLKDNKTSYNTLKEKYDILQFEFNKEKILFENKISILERRQDIYQKEVLFANARGGANKEEYERLEKERDNINQEIENIKIMEKILNVKANEINVLAMALNKLITSLNLDVKKFNEIGKEYEGEFEEGNYQKDKNGNAINIYQFDNREKLIRVLVHEFGHALGLEHLSNPKAIMYWLNNGINSKLTEDDLAELKRKCKL